MTIEHDPTLAVTCHAVASHEEVQKATAALEAMYNEYHENGGISPDTFGSSRGSPCPCISPCGSRA